MSYIIKNCPASQQGTCEKYGMCQDCTDCLLRQIVNKCKRTKLFYQGFDNDFILGQLTYADFILKDLDIEECE